MRPHLLLALSVVAHASARAAEQAPVVAVYEARRNAGSSASAEGIMKGIAAAGSLEVRRLTDLDRFTLAQVDVLVLADCHRPGRLRKDWESDVRRFVARGGGCLTTYHDHWLVEVGASVRRVDGAHRMTPDPKHSIVRGLAAFDTAAPYYLVQAVGKSGRPILRNAKGQPVAAAGKIGSGRVVSTGLGLGLGPGGKPVPPKGGELEFLRRCLRWLAPKQRWPERAAQVLDQRPIDLALAKPFALPGEPVVARVTAMTRAREPVTFQYRIGQGKWVATDLPVVQQDAAAKVSVRAGKISVALPADAGDTVLFAWTFRVGARFHGGEVKLPVQSPKRFSANEVRALYVPQPPETLPEGLFKAFADAGLNTVILRVQGSIDALPAVIDRARAAGLQVHAWRRCLDMTRAPKAARDQLRAEGRMMRSWQGSDVDWLCLSHAGNRAHEKAAAVELTKLGFDGVHLDQLGYPDEHACYCARCRKLFEEREGVQVANWPGDVRQRGPRTRAFGKFRERLLTTFAEECAQEVRAAKPGIVVSAGVMSTYPLRVFQNWIDWAKRDAFDCYMADGHAPHLDHFNVILKRNRGRITKSTPLLVQGIDIALPQGKMLSPKQLGLRITHTRIQRASGFVLYHYVSGKTLPLLTALRDAHLSGKPIPIWGK